MTDSERDATHLGGPPEWLIRVGALKSAWEAQRELLESQMRAIESRLPEPKLPGTRAFHALAKAQERTLMALFDARAAAAESLLIAGDASADFARLDAAHGTHDFAVRHLQVARVLLEAQEAAAATLLAAQAEVARVLDLDQHAEAVAVREKLTAPREAPNST